jgi:hypothetical protein
LELLLHHRHRLHVLEPEDEPTRRLLMLVEQRRRWVDEKTRHSNRLSDRLKVYFPQVLKWFQEIDEPAVLDLLERWPSLEQLQKAPRKSREALLRRHRRSAEEAAVWAEQVRSAVPAVKDAALLDCYRLEVTELVALLRQIQISIGKFDAVIADVSHQHPCWSLVQSLPGAGPAMGPRLLAALGTGQRYQNAQEMQCGTGIAPVTVASGRTRTIQFRRARPKFLRQTFHEWAQHSMKSHVGPESITISYAAPANDIMPRYALWRSNGNGFYFAAGETGCPMTKRDTSPVSRREIPLCPSGSRLRICKTHEFRYCNCEKRCPLGLDFTTQKSYRVQISGSMSPGVRPSH